MWLVKSVVAPFKVEFPLKLGLSTSLLEKELLTLVEEGYKSLLAKDITILVGNVVS